MDGPPPTIIKAPLQPILDSKCFLAESPIWEPETGTLHFVDILRHQIHHFHYETKRHTFDQYTEPIGCIALRKDKPGFVAGVKSGFALLPDKTPHHAEPSKSRHHTSRDLSSQRTDPEEDPHSHNIHPLYITTDVPVISDGRTRDRMFNDGACDPKGRFWAGYKATGDSEDGKDHSVQPGKFGSLEVKGDGKGVWREQLRDLTVPNGVGWTMDGRSMYFTDSMTKTIRRYSFDVEKGSLSDETDWVVVPEGEGQGVPDGLCMDEEDCVWSAKFGGSRVTRYRPDGTIDVEIEVSSVLNVTSCIFGGPDMDVLFITTASLGESGEDNDPEKVAKYEKDSGSVWAVHLPGIRGVERGKFAG